MSTGVYLDYNASSPLHPFVAEAMQNSMAEHSANPSSFHSYGRQARQKIEDARQLIAEYVGANADEIYFTPGGSASNQLALDGLLFDSLSTYVLATEHPSVLEPAKRQWKNGRPGSTLAVDSNGFLDIESTAKLQLQDSLVSLQWANNETGVIQKLHEDIGRLRNQGAKFIHSDGAQAIFRFPVNLQELDLDAMSFTAHKSFGPPGIGILYLRRGCILDPQFVGGKQERGVWPGTENLHGIVGVGALAQLAMNEELWPLEHLAKLQDSFAAKFCAIDQAKVHTPVDLQKADGELSVLPNTLSLGIGNIEAAHLLAYLDRAGFYLSLGSACATGSSKASPVLKAMGIPDALIRGSFRLSMGPSTREDDLIKLIELIEEWCKKNAR